MIPFEKAANWLATEKGVDKMSYAENPIKLARLFNGISDKIGDIIKNGFVNRIESKNGKVTKVSRVKDSKTGKAINFEWLVEPLDNSSVQSILDEQKEVITYMIAKRTLELQKKLGREDLLTGIGGGLFKDIDVAKKRLQEFEELPTEKKERLEEAARRYKEFSKAALKYAVQKGRLSEEAYKDITENNLEYVALQRIKEAASPEEEIVGFKSKKGQNLGASQEIVKKVKGSVQTINNPYQNLLENTINMIKESDRNNVLLQFKKLFTEERKMREGTPSNLAQIARPAKQGEPNTIAIFEDGKKEYWQLQPDVYSAVKNISESSGQLPAWVTFLPKLMRVGITNFPTFAIRNRLRDIQHRLVISQTRPLGDFSVELNKDVRKASKEAFEASGGGQAGYYLNDKNYYDGLLREATRKLANDPHVILSLPDKIANKFKDFSQAYHKLISSGEMATRQEEYRSAFKKAKKEGVDDYNASLYAAHEARDLMDFAVSGTFVKYLNQLIPFTNAAVQGLSKTIRSAKADPKGFMTRWFLYSVVPTVAVRLMAKSLGRDKDYEELPAWRRDLFYNIPVGKDLWLVIPKSFEIGVFASGVDRLVSQAMGHEDAFRGYWGSVYKNTLPVGIDDMVGPMKSLSGILTNYDYFTGKSIIPPYEKKLDLELRKGKKYASRLGQGLGALLQVDPRFVDYAIKNQTGYFGDWGLRLSDIGKEKTTHPFDITVTGLFRHNPVYDSKDVQHLFELIDRYGIPDRSGPVKGFKNLLHLYYDEKDAEEKVKLGDVVIDRAKELNAIFESPEYKEYVKNKSER
jgi:hypothetical protein